MKRSFLRVFFVFVLLPYSLLVTKFVRYMLPLVAVLDMMAAVGVMRIVRAVSAWPAPVLARQAAAAVVMLGEAPRIVSHYARRADLVSQSVTHHGVRPHAAEMWVLVQDGRVYFETLPVIAQLTAANPPEAQVRIGDVTAVRVLHLRGSEASLHARR